MLFSSVNVILDHARKLSACKLIFFFFLSSRIKREWGVLLGKLCFFPDTKKKHSHVPASSFHILYEFE